MTIELECVFTDTKRIETLDPQRLQGFKDAHKPGDVIRVIFDDSVEDGHSKLFKAFHVYRDQYAKDKGLDKEYAKALLKFKFGAGVIPWRPAFKPPVGERGSFLEVGERIYWMRSTTVYSTEDLGILIEGVISEINQS